MSERQTDKQREKTERSAKGIAVETWVFGGLTLLLLGVVLVLWLGGEDARNLILILGRGLIDWLSALKSDDARNLILLLGVIGGAVGLALAAWRSSVLQQQARTQQASLDHSQQVARRDSRFEIKRLAMEQLASDKAIVREAGVLALITAMEDPDEERSLELAALLSNYIGRAKYTIGSDGERIPPEQELIDDAVAALRLFGAQERRHQGLSNAPFVSLNLERVWLRKADLSDLKLNGMRAESADFNGANLKSSDLSNGVLNHADLSRAHLFSTILRDADLIGCQLARTGVLNANFAGADLAFSNLEGIRSLKQAQLDEAVQFWSFTGPENLPDNLAWDEEAARERWRVRQEQIGTR